MDWAKILEMSGGLITIVVAIYGITQFIDWRIERKIREEPFLRKISASLHPTVIFDESGAILYDQGAMQIIDKIEINRAKETDSLPAEIVITPKRHLAHAPLLQTLENELIDVSATRGKGFEWRYRLDYQMCNDVFNDKRRFRLEVLVSGGKGVRSLDLAKICTRASWGRCQLRQLMDGDEASDLQQDVPAGNPLNLSLWLK